MELQGISNTKEFLDQIDRKMVPKVVRPSLRAGAKIMQKAAIQNAPVESGFTKTAIKVRSGKRKKGVTTILVIIPRSAVGAHDNYYEGWVEFGHKIGFKGYKPSKTKEKLESRGVTGGTVIAVHWFLKSFEHTQQASIEAIQNTTTELLDKLKQELGGK